MCISYVVYFSLEMFVEFGQNNEIHRQLGWYIYYQRKQLQSTGYQTNYTFPLHEKPIRQIDDLVQDSSISSALVMGILQSCTKPARSSGKSVSQELLDWAVSPNSFACVVTCFCQL